MKTQTQGMNRRSFAQKAAVAALAFPVLTTRNASAAEEKAKSAAKDLRVAVVTGGHTYDVPNFHLLFRALPGVDAYIQHMEDFVATPVTVRDQYDVVVFYHMLMPGPEGAVKAVLEHLGSTEQGLVVMHHALLAHPQWKVWSDVVGIPDRKFGFHYNQRVQVRVANSQHPITRDLQPWEMTDETYTMADAGEGSDILLTTEHPKSMKTLAWTRTHKQSRVFCTESGHDNTAWSHPSFRQMLHRGIQWAAHKI
jgi:type 1 glutamine amidotransferase